MFFLSKSMEQQLLHELEQRYLTLKASYDVAIADRADASVQLSSIKDVVSELNGKLAHLESDLQVKNAEAYQVLLCCLYEIVFSSFSFFFTSL